MSQFLRGKIEGLNLAKEIVRKHQRMSLKVVARATKITQDIFETTRLLERELLESKRRPGPPPTNDLGTYRVVQGVHGATGTWLNTKNGIVLVWDEGMVESPPPEDLKIARHWPIESGREDPGPGRSAAGLMKACSQPEGSG